MATIQSLVESIGVLKRNPVVFAVGLLYGAIVLPQSVLSVLGIPLVPRLLQIVTFFITPFVLAGLLGMVYEGRVRATGFGTFTKLGKSKYLSILLGHLIRFVIQAAFTVVAFFVVVFTVGLGLSAANSASALRSLGIVAAALFGGLLIVYLFVMFFLQFYAPAIVTDNVGALEGYTRSVGVVKRNPVQTLGFGVLNLLFSLLLLVPGIALVAVSVFGTGVLSSGAMEISQSAGRGAFGLGIVAGLTGYSILTTTLMKPFQAAFSVSFYDNHRPAGWD